MPRRRYLFDPPERFVAGTVGLPGDRTFFLQARDGPRVVSVVMEKIQVAVLAERLGELVAELERRGVAGDAGRVLVEARAQSEDGEVIDPDEDDDEDEDGPDLLRVRMSLDAARSFVARAGRVVAAGRPPCPLCGNPLDPQGHICPRQNGHFVN